MEQTDIGPQLLGRLDFEEDERDYKAENFIGLGAVDASDPVALATQAEAELKLTTTTYKYWASHNHPDVETTHWWLALNALNTIIGGTPNPNPPPPPSGDVLWGDPDAILDQGQYGTCVGNGTAQFLNTNPISDNFSEGMGKPATEKGPYARAIYYEATVLDGAPDDPNSTGGGQQGASVRSGMKALKNRARISSYVLLSNTDDITAWLRTKGPVVIGSNWYNDMFNPDDEGFITPTGPLEGGHCYLLVGVSADGLTYTFLNSWGTTWGLKGYFKMTVANYKKLLGNNGEAWGALELPLS